MTRSAVDRPSKPCAVCGRTITWRKSWERDWPSIRYCSDRCRRAGLTPTDRDLERALLALLATRPRGATISPDEAARVVAPTRWPELTQAARNAARRLVETGVVEIVQAGRAVDPSTAKGPILVRRTHPG